MHILPQTAPQWLALLVLALATGAITVYAVAQYQQAKALAQQITRDLLAVYADQIDAPGGVPAFVDWFYLLLPAAARRYVGKAFVLALIVEVLNQRQIRGPIPPR